MQLGGLRPSIPALWSADPVDSSSGSRSRRGLIAQRWGGIGPSGISPAVLSRGTPPPAASAPQSSGNCVAPRLPNGRLKARTHRSTRSPPHVAGTSAPGAAELSKASKPERAPQTTLCPLPADEHLGILRRRDARFSIVACVGGYAERAPGGERGLRSVARATRLGPQEAVLASAQRLRESEV
jgi:hypothetical protein